MLGVKNALMNSQKVLRMSLPLREGFGGKIAVEKSEIFDI
jgi:hypothetical protein